MNQQIVFILICHDNDSVTRTGLFFEDVLRTRKFSEEDVTLLRKEKLLEVRDITSLEGVISSVQKNGKIPIVCATWNESLLTSNLHLNALSKTKTPIQLLCKKETPASLIQYEKRSIQANPFYSNKKNPWAEFFENWTHLIDDFEKEIDVIKKASMSKKIPKKPQEKVIVDLSVPKNSTVPTSM